MKASELRIGNLIYDIGDAIIKVDADIIQDISIGVERYYPIPLTPEILEEFGFVKTRTPFYEIDLGNNIGQLKVNPDNGMVWIAHHRVDVMLINPMVGNNLHSIQNLYFSLTGRELEIIIIKHD